MTNQVVKAQTSFRGDLREITLYSGPRLSATDRHGAQVIIMPELIVPDSERMALYRLTV
jgi:hypothetical protein